MSDVEPLSPAAFRPYLRTGCFVLFVHFSSSIFDVCRLRTFLMLLLRQFIPVVLSVYSELKVNIFYFEIFLSNLLIMLTL